MNNNKKKNKRLEDGDKTRLIPYTKDVHFTLLLMN